MKTLFPVLLFLLLPFQAPAGPQKAVKSATETKSRTYQPVSAKYKQLRLSTLPAKGGRVDAREMVLRSAGTTPEALASLTKKQKRHLAQVAKYFKKNDTKRASASWEKFIKNLDADSEPADINALIHQVIRESYLESEVDLNYYATKVSHLNEIKMKIRRALKELRDIRARHAAGLKSSGAVIRRDALLKKIDKDITAWEDELNSLGDDAQLASLALQDAMNKQAQMMQMISNISKMMHDTAKAIISNMK